ncbi:MAG: hypothetical protein K1T65_03070 [Candidatus Aramenus sp.]|nr:hypothetical protein [Candidatus Aramenus sp.]
MDGEVKETYVGLLINMV